MPWLWAVTGIWKGPVALNPAAPWRSGCNNRAVGSNEFSGPGRAVPQRQPDSSYSAAPTLRISSTPPICCSTDRLTEVAGAIQTPASLCKAEVRTAVAVLQLKSRCGAADGESPWLRRYRRPPWWHRCVHGPRNACARVRGRIGCRRRYRAPRLCWFAASRNCAPGQASLKSAFSSAPGVIALLGQRWTAVLISSDWSSHNLKVVEICASMSLSVSSNTAAWLMVGITTLTPCKDSLSVMLFIHHGQQQPVHIGLP